MVKFSVRLEGDKELVRKLGQLKGGLGDLSGDMKRLGDFFVRFFSRDVFATEGDIVGEQWPRLSPKYEFWKRIKYAGRGILVRSGKLQKAYRMNYGSDFVRIYNPIEYAIYHQEGSGRLPKRTLVKIDQERKQYIIDVIKQAVARKIRSAFK